jgi:hypothetical protein
VDAFLQDLLKSAQINTFARAATARTMSRVNTLMRMNLFRGLRIGSLARLARITFLSLLTEPCSYLTDKSAAEQMMLFIFLTFRLFKAWQ